MPEDTPPVFESFNPAVAASMRDPAVGAGGGLMAYLGMSIVDVGPGTATGEIEVRPELVHGFGAVHGGVVASLVDHVLGAAILPVVPEGTWPATLEFKINYLAAVREGVIRATGTVLALRRRTAVVGVEVTNEGRPVAAALGTISVNPPRSSRDA